MTAYVTVGLFAHPGCSKPPGKTSPEGAGAQLQPPPLDQQTPAEYPGLHNVVAYADRIYSGSAPDGIEGFETLRRLGVRTILSVDGAVPDIAAAKTEGLRYVHLPIGYNGFDDKRKLELARAVRDLPRPIYIHCHHGKHRSAAAAGAAVATLGLSTPDESIARMKISGTSPSYAGLYRCVSAAAAASVAMINAADASFPETTRPSGLVHTMTEIDEVSDRLKAVQAANWKTPPEHPDLVPAAEAGRLADLFRTVADDEHVRTRPSEFAVWLRGGSKLATALEEGIVSGDAGPNELTTRYDHLMQSCKTCHAKYRD